MPFPKAGVHVSKITPAVHTIYIPCLHPQQGGQEVKRIIQWPNDNLELQRLTFLTFFSATDILWPWASHLGLEPQKIQRLKSQIEIQVS